MKEKPIKKAWKCIMPEEQWGNLSHSPSIVYAETRSKARYRFNIENEFEWSDPCGFIFIKVKRSKENDLYAPKNEAILGDLTENQIKIISHANGNQRCPGNRDYYYCSSKNKDLLRLVELGLMIGPQHTDSGMIYPGNGYFYLTQSGKKAAFSLLPRMQTYYNQAKK